jgi:hypothetical protein
MGMPAAPSVKTLRILSIQLPLERVVGDVRPNGGKIPFMANHKIVEAMLPETAGIARPSLRCHSLPVRLHGEGLEALDHRCEG